MPLSDGRFTENTVMHTMHSKFLFRTLSNLIHVSYFGRQSDSVFAGLTMPNPTVLPALLAQISRRLTPQPAKIRADIEVTCFSYDGIDAIKAALLQGEKMSTEQCPIKVKLVAPPLYVVVANTLDKEIGLATVTSGVEKIREVIESFGGELGIKKEVFPLPPVAALV
jgi:translation initiation factor 2 alpha subunit (eIF-2alpha)